MTDCAIEVASFIGTGTTKRWEKRKRCFSSFSSAGRAGGGNREHEHLVYQLFYGYLL